MISLNEAAKNQAEINEEIEHLNQVLQEKNEILISTKQNLENDISEKKNELNRINRDIYSGNSQILELNEKYKEDYVSLFERAKKEADEKFCLYSQNLKNQENEKIRAFNERIQEEKDFLNKEYDLYFEELNSDILKKNEELFELKSQLDNYKAKQDAIISAKIREQEKKSREEFYKIQISTSDLVEVNRIREIIPYFRTSRPLCKAIWESYYRNPVNDLLNRIGATNGTTGIYMITNVKNGKPYIGQAKNLNDRLKSHIKAGIGIDTPNAHLYTEMIKYGVENFTFEILENCKIEELNEREKYYIDFYKTLEFGNNEKAGGARIYGEG